MARVEDVRSIGIDLEPATPLKESLWRRVCTPKEREWLHELPAPGLTGKILFSAKESVYKCQYPITTNFLGFHAVEVEIGPGDVMSGRYLVEEGLVATACELPR
ncbi:MAG: 4'-phosphopantetheinyl transferase superfamily protein [Deltaproteobacteria bacterium]|nr:4'-phosphopantetheinyl transferase superfamily protein [Deltaproteobacteria bacterium]